MPLPSTASEHIWYLKFQNSNLRRELEAYKSGNKFRKLREKYEALLEKKDAEIRALKEECGRAHAETVTVRKYWSEIFDDVEAERKKAVLKAQSGTKRMEERALAAERKNDELSEKLKEERREKYELGEKLEEAEGLNKKLTAQVNRDFENSSTPSSLQGAGRKKIPNSREKTGKKPGGQPGHKGAGRKKHTPDTVVVLEDPKEYTENPDYYKTDKVLSRQLVGISVTVHVTEYHAHVWRRRTTGSRVHAAFPAGVTNDVNYGGSVKAFTFLLGNECNVSHPKMKKFLNELTGGEIDISVGMINGLCEEFSAKTEPEKKRILEKLMSSPVMNVDFTNANVGGKSAQVLVLASEQNRAALYVARQSKGHNGIAGTPVENYVGTLTHDHDTTFYSYGLRHQECQQHNIRYAKGCIENEPELTWCVQMLGLIREMLHYRNSLGDTQLDAETVKKFEERYDRILDLAEQEYLDHPPSDYYREGYNLSLRLRKYKESELLFLHDKSVPSNNSLCERLARVFKRKQKQAMVFRSFENLSWLCDSMSIVYLLRQDSGNVYRDIVRLYEKPRTRKRRRKKKAAMTE